MTIGIVGKVGLAGSAGVHPVGLVTIASKPERVRVVLYRGGFREDIMV